MKNQIYHAKCLKTGQHFLIETQSGRTGEVVVNFQDITDEKAKEVGGSGSWPELRASEDLRPCRWCGNRVIGGCSCQKKKNLCPPKGSYSYQCLFCDQLVPETAATDVKSLRLSVTSPCFDDIGAVLRDMGLTTMDFSKAGFNCDILFLNCGTTDKIDSDKFRTFIENGGCAYVSDWAASFLESAFPYILHTQRSGEKDHCSANIIDPEIRSVVGSSIEIDYDLGMWAMIRSHKGKCLIQGTGKYSNLPMMVTLEVKKGKIFYTSFHNHAQTSEKEKALLKTMLLRQIGAVTNQSVADVSRILGLNISEWVKIRH